MNSLKRPRRNGWLSIRMACALLAGPILLAIAACGGGSSSGGSPAPITISSIKVTCSPADVGTGATSQCGATVQGTGTYSSAVTWTATAGSINPSGVFTAPASASSVTITATSTQDTSKSGTASIAVTSTPSTITSVAATCTPAIVAVSVTSQCSAAVQGTGSFSSTVTWTASAGSIDSSGVFTAPAVAASVIVTATSTQDTSKSGTASIAVTSTPSTITSVAASCTPAIVAVSVTSQCSAAVQGTGSFSSTVTWTASAGSIDSSGVFTAPAVAASVIVTATSVQDKTKTGEAAVTVRSQTPPSKHVVMVVEENHSYSAVVGNTSAWPNFNILANKGGLAANYYADSHPSIGNYFMLTTGQILTTNDSSTTVWNVDNIARHMLAASVSFKIYAEGIPNGYLGGNTGLYVIRHNPFAMLSDVASDPQIADQCIWPFSQLTVDLAANALPAFSFIVPDLNDDAHNGTPQLADAWLQTNVIAPLSANTAFQPGGDGLLIVVFDEAATSDSTQGGGHIAAVFWGPNVKPGYVQTSTTVYQHESMLRTVMEQLGLANPPGAAASAPSMTEFFLK